MPANLHQRWHALHAAAGAVFGVILFVVLFTGALAVLRGDFAYWQQRDAALAISPPADPQRWLQAVSAGSSWPERITMIVPREIDRAVTISMSGHPSQRLDPLTLQPLPPVATDWVDRMVNLHRTLHAGFPGRIVASLFGAALVLLVVGGLVVQARQWRNALRLRWRAGWRVLLSDAHRLVGWWTSPWLLMLALTGIFSGLGALGTMALAGIAFPGGGMRQAMAALMAPPAPLPAGAAVAMVDLTALLRRLATDDPGFHAERIELSHWGRAGASLTLSGRRDGLLSTALFEGYRFAGRDGALLERRSARERGGWTRAFIAVAPLHQALYGGAWMRWWHAVVGLGGAALALSGTVMWLDRRRRSGRVAVAWLKALVPGVCGGLVLASVCSLAVSSWPGLPSAVEAGTFWSVWLATCLCVVRPAWRTHLIFRLLAALCTGLVMAALSDLLQRAGQSTAVAWPAWRIDGLLLVLAVASGYSGWRWRKTR